MRLFRPWLIWLTAFVLIPVFVGGGFWLVLLSPFRYEFPPTSLVLDDGPHAVFAYGTLTHPLVRRLVIGRWVETRPAELPFHRQERLNLVPAEDEHTRGVVFEVSGAELMRLDRYERLGIRYQRELRLLADGDMAWVYLRLEEPHES